MAYKIKSDRYVEVCTNILKNRKTRYKNTYPYNCGYYDGTYLYGDCWNFNPKSLIWAESIGKPLDKAYTVGRDAVDERYNQGIKKTGLPDVTGDVIMANYCTQVSFANMIKNKKAPCMLLITGQHMGAYIGEFKYNGNTYNTCEYTNNSYLGNGLCISYCDENGARRVCKGGKIIGYWNKAGYLTSFVDYTTTEKKVEKLTTEQLALSIIAGTYGSGQARIDALKEAGYTDAEIKAAQTRVNELLAPKKDKLSAEEIADKIIAGEYGNGANRISALKAEGYTEAEIKEAQAIVNNKIAEINNGAAVEGKPLTKAQADEMFKSMKTPTKDEVKKLAKSMGMGGNAFAALLGWVQGEGYWGVNDPYLAYLSACVMINNILEGAYGTTGTAILNKIATWGAYYSVLKQKNRANNPSDGALKATYMGLKYLQKGIHCCYGPGYKPDNCFYDPHLKTDDWIYVF